MKRTKSPWKKVRSVVDDEDDIDFEDRDDFEDLENGEDGTRRALHSSYQSYYNRTTRLRERPSSSARVGVPIIAAPVDTRL